MTDTLPKAQAFTAEQTADLLARFRRDGAVHAGRLLARNEAAALCRRVDELFADSRAQNTDTFYGSYIAVRLFEWDPRFRDLMVREPMVGLMEALLGPDCHLIANNIVRNAPGQAIDNFHADDFLWFPLPPEVPRFDARATFPTFIVNVQVPLTDVEADQFGPTQYVPGSHYSGRKPNDPKAPVFEGRGPVSIHAQAGEFYLQHSQVWHRGAPNTSTRTRYLLQYSYGMRFVAQRFFPFLNYRMPDAVLAGASERLLRVLGKHPKGAYG